MFKIKFVLIACFSLLLSISCLSAGCITNNIAENDSSSITIHFAEQYGLQYAPVYVMKEMGYLEELLPEANLQWTKLGGGSAMNEALISNSLDVAFMGIPPVLIAIDSGASYRIASGICVPPAELMVSANSGIKSLSDLDKEGNNIAVPSIGSIQNIMLSKACKEQLGSATALDDNLVAMGNADAYAAFLTNSVTAHFASMPYIAYETRDGKVSILNADDCGGGASIVCVTTSKIHDNKKVYNALMTALGKAIEKINTQDNEVLEIIARNEKCTPDDAKDYLNWEGTKYTQDIYSLVDLGSFMADENYLKHEFKGFDYYCWDNAVNADA